MIEKIKEHIEVVGIIVTIVTTIITFAYFIGSLNTRVSNLESQLGTISTRVELENKVSKLEEQMKNLSDKLDGLTQIPKQESCSLINPVLNYPHSETEVSEPVELKGTVNKIPEISHLWVIAYNLNTKKYSDFKDIVPDQDKGWQKKITLVGGKTGDLYEINIVLADRDEHAELIKCRHSTLSCSVPPIIKWCQKITLKLKS